MMTRADRPSLDSLVPLMMIEENVVIDQHDELVCQPAEGLRNRKRLGAMVGNELVIDFRNTSTF